MLRRLIKMMYVNDTAWNRLVVDYCVLWYKQLWKDLSSVLKLVLTGNGVVT